MREWLSIVNVRLLRRSFMKGGGNMREWILVGVTIE